MKGIEWIGWASSVILLLTVAVQIRKQWKAGTSEGVSKWLFLGQVGAEVGFVVYSWLVGNWVFVFTNLALLIENLVGFAIVLRHRRREAARVAAR